MSALAGTVLLLVVLVSFCWWTMIRMPGRSVRENRKPPTESERDLAASLRRDVEFLALEIGERNIPREPALRWSADWLEEQLSIAGHAPHRHSYTYLERSWDNVEVELPGQEDENGIIVVGAHYDSVVGSPGANDNGSGCAALLELARHFAGTSGRRALRLVFFANEEPPTFLG